MPFVRDQLAACLQVLATRGVYLGTSSWKYAGWLGQVYERDRYIWRGRFSQARFERDCLAEYAQTFPTVSVDASYYQFFKPRTLLELAAQVPGTFRFAFKVCGDITLRRFPQLPRFGQRAGTANPHFLDAARFTEQILEPYAAIRGRVGLLAFEFSHFGPGEFARGGMFVEALNDFLGKLPRGWPYGVEIRNRQWLHPEYFSVLARHQVSHIFNAWSDMPPVDAQLALAGSESNPDLLAARLLLREGRTYNDAVTKFSPYAEIKDPNLEGRAAAAALGKRALSSQGKTKVFIYVNNRFEGNSPETIHAIASELQAGN